MQSRAEKCVDCVQILEKSEIKRMTVSSNHAEERGMCFCPLPGRMRAFFLEWDGNWIKFHTILEKSEIKRMTVSSNHAEGEMGLLIQNLAVAIAPSYEG